MPQYYIYLISSLPMLHWGIKPPLSFRQFLKICQEKVTPGDLNILKAASLIGECPHGISKIDTLKKWYSFDAALRNGLVKIRAQRLHIDPDKYLRQDQFTDPSIAHIAIGAYRNPSLLEAERMLDEARWRKLEELAVGHYFDIDFLIIYAYKLLFLERWEKIGSADRPRMLEKALN